MRTTGKSEPLGYAWNLVPLEDRLCMKSSVYEFACQQSCIGVGLAMEQYNTSTQRNNKNIKLVSECA